MTNKKLDADKNNVIIKKLNNNKIKKIKIKDKIIFNSNYKTSD